ncbi:MAG TPA: histidine--tRNA ligase [Gemmatimonadaceae bacterium]|nr:histidine--tRNA ligase [Gemmatimonadaceae bacterium]
MASGALPGFRDFYPAELAERSHIFATWREVARRYGFVEYDGPPLEPLELYTRKSGDEIVGQLYEFTDKGGRRVALRPEMTPTLARMVGARANALRKPIRWASMPQLFRYERQQRGRLREHFQLNLDIIGEADVSADAELLAAAIDIMRAFGLTANDVVARVSDRRLLHAVLTAIGITAEQLPAAYAVMDKVQRDTREHLEGRLSDAGISPGASAQLFELAHGVDDLDAFARWCEAHDCAAPFALVRRYLSYLDALGLGEWVRLDLSIVRGLAYYTGIVFELFDVQGELRAICGGGRYDSLLKALGGVDLPALGFGMGDVVLGELLRARGLTPTHAPGVDVWVAYADGAALTDAMRVAAQLRARGRSVEYALGGQKLSRQLRAAGSAGARDVLILPASDGAAREAVVRNLARGEERHVRLDDWLNEQQLPDTHSERHG